MNIEVGSVVSIEGSDTLWVVDDIDKGFLDLTDDVYGTIELKRVSIGEVTGVVEGD